MFHTSDIQYSANIAIVYLIFSKASEGIFTENLTLKEGCTIFEVKHISCNFPSCLSNFCCKSQCGSDTYLEIMWSIKMAQWIKHKMSAIYICHPP